jgi:hypothetical protein
MDAWLIEWRLDARPIDRHVDIERGTSVVKVSLAIEHRKRERARRRERTAMPGVSTGEPHGRFARMGLLAVARGMPVRRVVRDRRQTAYCDAVT